MVVKNKSPYGQAFYPPRPTRRTLFMRKFVPWQIIRFIAINIKMVYLIFKGEHN